MLVVTRRPGEAVIIGDGIRVVLLSVDGDRVRLGIEAPKDVPIRRSEAAAGPETT
jgi:carbon storage regulator